MSWEKVNIADVTNNLDSKRIPLNASQRSEKESNPIYPYIGANKIMGYIDEYIFDEKILCVAEDGGSWGYNETCANIYNEKVWVNNHAHVLTAKDNLILEFLRYYLNYSDLSLHINGATRGKLTKSALNSIKIPLPPLETQKKIASILDAADAYRQKTKTLIEKYDELTQSLFLEMFGDPFTNKKEFPIAKLGDLCDELFLGLTSKVDYVDVGGFPLIRATDINKGVLNLENVKFISEEQHRKLTARRITQRGDVLISKSGSLGTCTIVDTDEEFSTYESIFTVRPKASLLSNTFLVHLVRNEGFQLKLLGKQVGGTVAHLNLKMFRDFEFPLPPVTDQELFTKRALYLEAQKAQAQQSLEKAEELFNSLLQRAFSGNL